LIRNESQNSTPNRRTWHTNSSLIRNGSQNSTPNRTPIPSVSIPEKFIFRHFAGIPSQFTDFKKCRTSGNGLRHTYELEEFCGQPFEQELTKASRFDVRSRYLPASYATSKPTTRRIFTGKGVGSSFVGAIYDSKSTLVIEGSGEDLMSDTMRGPRASDGMLPDIINRNRSRFDFSIWYKNAVRKYHESFNNWGAGASNARINKKFCEIYKDNSVKICKQNQVSQQQLLDYVEAESGKSIWNNEVVISPTPKDLKGFFFVGDDWQRVEAKNSACEMRSIFLDAYETAKDVSVWECQTVWGASSRKELSKCDPVAC